VICCLDLPREDLAWPRYDLDLRPVTFRPAVRTASRDRTAVTPEATGHNATVPF
jgi:hypothetical protein